MGGQAVGVWQRSVLLHTELLRVVRAGRFRQFQRTVGEEGWRFLVGTAALLDGDHERAIILLSHCGDAPEALLNLALAWRMAGEEERGRRMLAKVEAIVPDLVRPHVEPVAPPFRITYLLPHLGNTGGMRVISRQMKELARRGHEVRALYLAYPAVVPDSRFTDAGIELVPVPPADDFTCHIPPSNFVVACFWDQLFLAVEAAAGFPVYLAQGDSWTFAPDQLPVWEAGLLRDLHCLPVAIVAVSGFLATAIERLAGRRAAVINPGLDLETFEGVRVSKAKGGVPRGGKPRIVLVAPDGPGKEFKGVGDMVVALEILRRNRVLFEAVWVTPSSPARSFPGRVVVNPPRVELARLLAEADVYVCGSHYEAFPLPPLEAMAAGTAVVSTRNGGVEEYAVDGWNCLLVPAGDPPSLAAGITRLLEDPDLHASLVEHGLETAGRFSWEVSVDRLERFFLEIASGPRPVSCPLSWLQTVGGRNG